jgi:hypothetical protein
MQAYRNDLRQQLWQLSPDTRRAWEIQRQLDAPDPQ